MTSTAGVTNHNSHNNDNNIRFESSNHDEESMVDSESSIWGTELAKKETKAVATMRLGLFITLVTATILVAYSAYYVTHSKETSLFKIAFASGSLEIAETFQTIAEQRFGAIASLATSITAHALSTNSVWPFVTVPNLEAQADHIRSLASAASIAFAPIVNVSDRLAWEEYTVANAAEWVCESNEYWDDDDEQEYAQCGPELHANSQPLIAHATGQSEPLDFSTGFSHRIYTKINDSLAVASDDEGPFLPWWQQAPQTRNQSTRFINFDLSIDSTFQGNLLPLLQNKTYGLGQMSETPYSIDTGTQTGPISGVYYPILDGFHSNSNVVATVAALVYWESFFVNVLPRKSGRLLVVLQNTCDQSYSFLVDGQTVQSLGEGDLHDTSYDSVGVNASFTDLISEGIQNEKYRGFPCGEDYGCQYFIHVYPTKEMEDTFHSNHPAIITSGAVLIFLLTSLAFLVYDRLVERRQRLVLKEAEDSGAIVSSLFPSAYRQRLMNSYHELRQRHQSREQVRDFIQRSDMNMNHENNSAIDCSPIADLYSDCTVFFADLVGFTKWSSARDPTEVFKLLQALFGEFDAAAKRRKIFKVETIGDCYMAVTGLPDPQEDHAIAMARFANDCQMKMYAVTTNLSKSLGEETESLSLRIGIHSGPVTAGILQGEKSRFQLFGDTVNYASRMESTGERGRIQVSSETAKLLRDAGKGHWLEARQGRVDAKGIGTLDTYWLIRRGRYNAGAAVRPRSIDTSTDVMGGDNAGQCNGSFNPETSPCDRDTYCEQRNNHWARVAESPLPD